MPRETLAAIGAGAPPAYVACAAVNSSTVRSAKRVRPFFIRLPLCWLCASMAAALAWKTASRCSDSSHGGAEPGQ